MYKKKGGDSDYKELYSRRFMGLIIVALGIISFLLVRPLISVILSSIILAYAFYPIYERVRFYLKSENASAAIVALLIILLIALPFFFLANSLRLEVADTVTDIYLRIRQTGQGASGPIIGKVCNESEGFVCSLIGYFNEITASQEVRTYISKIDERISTWFIDFTSNMILSVIRLMVNFFIMLFIVFYLFKDGRRIITEFEDVLPIKSSHKKRIVDKFSSVVSGVIYGVTAVAVIQGVCASIGFYIFGVSSPLVWGLAIAVAAMIPLLGPIVIWLPLALGLLISGYSTRNSGLIIRGFGVLLYGALIINSIDNFVIPKIIGGRGRVHPVIVLLGIIGGLKLFGFIGLVMGPLLLSLFITFLRLYYEESIGLIVG